MRRLTINCFPGDRSRFGRLLRGLSELYPVDFRFCSTLDQIGPGPSLLLDVSGNDAMRVASSGHACLAFVESSSDLLHSESARIEFTQASYLPVCCRGRAFLDTQVSNRCALAEEPGDQVLARIGTDAVWVHRVQGNVTLDLVGLEPPRIADDGYLFQSFLPGNWMRLLPILQFIRGASEAVSWDLPPLRACFMFDDPNLHALTYGYVDYTEIASDANRHNYHVSFATVPFDGWYVNRRAAAFFRENTRYISLLVHGNNHSYRELAQPLNPGQRRLLSEQSLARISRLEKASGLEVSRVMAAPHGACRAEIATSLLQSGYEAACISRGSIMSHNKQYDWPLTVGMNPAEFLGDGLPVIPRFGMLQEAEIRVMFAAFCGQPIVPMGHHGDIAGGLDLLRRLAELINSLGDVQWMNLSSIARTNFSTRREDALLRVRLLSRQVKLTVPEGVFEVCIEHQWAQASEPETLMVRAFPSGTVRVIEAFFGAPFKVSPGEMLEVTVIRAWVPSVDSSSGWKETLAAAGRRPLCEVRDRALPLVRRLVPR